MDILLKVMLGIIALACIYLDYFTWSEYRIWKNSQESEESSMFERMLVNVMALSVFVVLSGMAFFSILFIFSQINITLPAW